jgi:hypothetical protein
MNNLLYVVYKDINGLTETGVLYTDITDFIQDTWNPEDKARVEYTMNFVIKGKTYRERKAALEEIAKDFQNHDVGGLYWSDEILLQNYFEENAKRYGLIEEFRENGII